MSEKYIKDGLVVVLYSPGYGSGWYTWNSRYPECLFCPEIAKLVEEKMAIEEDLPYGTWGDKKENKENRKKVEGVVIKIKEKAKEIFGDGFCDLGAEQLKIEWMGSGQAFIIKDFDGSERIEYCYGDWIVA